MRPLRRLLPALLAGLGVVVAAGELRWSSLFHADQRLIDFRVFWCGGRVALEGASPYLFEPLRSCEHQYGAGIFDVVPNFVMPFVLPPYDIAVFAQFARIAYETAAWAFIAIGTLALLASIALVAASARVPVVLAAAGLLFSVGFPSLMLGQIVPLELLFVSATAFALVRRWDAAAGVCAVLTLLEPHVGAFVVVCVAASVPRARLALAGGLAVLAFATVRAANVAPVGVYLATLGEHARAEAGSYGQYSLTYVLRYFHTPMDIAIGAGAFSTVALLAVAIVLSRAAAKRDLRAGIVYLPVACAVAGGTFVHLTQIALAVPAALMVFAYARDPLVRRLSAVALVALAVPWQYPATNKQTLASALLVVAVTLWYVTRGNYRTVIAAVVVMWLAFVPIENSPLPPAPLPQISTFAPSAPASAAWRQALESMNSEAPRFILVKLPTWCGLLAVIGAAFMLMRDGRRNAAG